MKLLLGFRDSTRLRDTCAQTLSALKLFVNAMQSIHRDIKARQVCHSNQALDMFLRYSSPR